MRIYDGQIKLSLLPDSMVCSFPIAEALAPSARYQTVSTLELSVLKFWGRNLIGWRPIAIPPEGGVGRRTSEKEGT